MNIVTPITRAIQYFYTNVWYSLLCRSSNQHNTLYLDGNYHVTTHTVDVYAVVYELKSENINPFLVKHSFLEKAPYKNRWLSTRPNLNWSYRKISCIEVSIDIKFVAFNFVSPTDLF